MAKKSKYIDDKTIHEILKPYAYKAFKDLSAESRRVIDVFYNDNVFNGSNKPMIYQRTFGMKNLFKPEMKKIKNGYRIEFTYSVDYLTTEHRSNDAVFTGSFVYGWHGGKYAWGHLKPFVPQTKPSPWKALEMYVRTYKIQKVGDVNVRFRKKNRDGLCY